MKKLQLFFKRKRNLKCFLTVFFVLVISQSKAQYATDSTEVSLITASKGLELYSAFGHSAIHVKDVTQNIDYIYNFGVFDFSTPHFYTKFCEGRLLYSLGMSYYTDFVDNYREYGQALYEQKLCLTKNEKNTLLQKLEINYREENRYYRYDFFFDNCATRIRDIIESSIDGKVIYDSTYVSNYDNFRHLTAKQLDTEPWIVTGMNIIAGKNYDKTLTLRDYMFLPENLKNQFASATIAYNGITKTLTLEPVEVLPSKIVFEKTSALAKPRFVFWAFFLLVLLFSIWGLKNNKSTFYFDIFYFLITGIAGIFIFWLVSSSLHSVLNHNYNIVWLNPLNIFFALGFAFFSNRNWFRKCVIAYLVVLFIFQIASFFFIQEIPREAIPLIGIMVMRMLKYVVSGKQFV